MNSERSGDPVALLDDGTTNGGLGLVVWGFATVVAVILGFASWQYAPPRPVETEQARAPSSPEEITGTIAVAERGIGPAQPTRIVGSGRITPMTLGPGEVPVSTRDLEQVRSELRDLQRRIAQMGLSGDGVSRRLDRLEDRLTSLAAATTAAAARHAEAAPAAAPAPRAEVAAPAEETAAAAEAVRLPQPRPDGDQPTITGSVPPKPVTPGKGDRQGTAAPPVETIAVKPTQPSAPLPAPGTASPVSILPGAGAGSPASPPAAPPTGPAPTSAVAPEAAGAGAVAPVAAIDLGGYRSLASLKKSWSDMTERYAEFGNGIEALARLRETDSGMEARLVAGPYPSRGDAAKACARMKALGVACVVTGFSGQPLAAIR